MSDTENAADNPSHNVAILHQRAEPKEGEGNVRPVSLVQQTFSDPEALNFLRQAFHSSSHEDGAHGALKAPSSVTKSTSAGASKAHSAMEMTPLPIPRRLKGQ